jgi:hypothetical protein
VCDVKILFLSYLIRLAGVNVTENDVKITEDDVNLTVRVSVYQDSLFIDLRVYEELNYLMNDWASHSMNNNIVYEESFNSTKKARVSRETNNAMIEDQRFY